MARNLQWEETKYPSQLPSGPVRNRPLPPLEFRAGLRSQARAPQPRHLPRGIGIAPQGPAATSQGAPRTFSRCPRCARWIGCLGREGDIFAACGAVFGRHLVHVLEIYTERRLDPAESTRRARGMAVTNTFRAQYRKSHASKALSMDELSSYFHLPINEVASKVRRRPAGGLTRLPSNGGLVWAIHSIDDPWRCRSWGFALPSSSSGAANTG